MKYYLIERRRGKRKYKYKIMIRTTRRRDFGARLIDDLLIVFKHMLGKCVD